MDIYSDLVSAGFEKLAAHPTNTFLGRVYLNTTDSMPYFYNGTKWEVFTSIKNSTAAVDPAGSDDDSANFEVGSMWINTVTQKIFVCIDATTGAAEWRPLESEKNNFTSTVDPVETNDSSEGYTVGSKWVNTVDAKSYTCVNASVGAAEWVSGGGGVGDSSIYKVFDMDTDGKLADWTTIGDTALTEETTTPLKGKKSLKYTQVATSTVGDKTTLSYFPVPEQAKDNNTHILKFRCRLDSANDRDFAVNIIGVAATVRSTVEIVNGKTTVNKIFTYDSADTNLGLQIEVLTANDGASITIDSIEFSDSPFGEASLEKKETITYKGYTSINISNIVKFTTEETNTSNDIIEIDNVTYSDHTRYIFKSSCSFYSTASINSSSVIGEFTLRMYDEAGTTKLYSSQYNTYTKSVSLSGNAKAGDYLLVTNDQAITDSISNFFSVTASATQDYVLAEDEREQAHFVGKAVYNLSSNYSTTSGTYVLPSLTLSSSSLSGILVQNTASSPSITVPNAKVGTYLVSVSGMMGDGDAFRKYLTITDGTVNYSEQTGYSGWINNAVFTVENTVSGNLNLDLNVKVGGGTAYFNASTPLELSVSYLPPSTQATQPIVLAAPKQYENDLEVNITPTGTIISGNTTLMTMSTSASVSTLDYSALNLTTIPTISETPVYNAASSFQHRLISVTTTQAVMRMDLDRNNDSAGVTSVSPTSWMVKLSKQGADRRDAGVIGVGDVKQGMNHSTQEFWTGDYFIDGRKIYARTYQIASDITATTTIDTIDTGLELIGHVNHYQDYWVIEGYSEPGTATDRYMIQYRESTGSITGVASGILKIGAGTTFTIKYVR